MATTYISRTFTASATGEEQWTLSMWVKRGGLGATQYLFNAYSDTNNYTGLYFDSNDKLYFTNTVGGSDAGTLHTNRVFRDTSGWCSIVVVWDSNNGSAGDRMRMYINGVEETSFATDTNPSSGQDSFVGDSGKTCLLGHKGEASFYFNGDMSHVQLVDSAALAATEFGEVDSTSGIWKIKTACYATPGTNGFCLQMEDRSNLDLDSSSNALTFTTSGTGTATYDNPSNNFCTMNPLDNYYAGSTFSNGNNTIATASSVYTWNTGTMGLGAGLWYFEIKIATGVTSNYHNIGVATRPTPSATIYLGDAAYSWAYVGNDGKIWTNTSGTAYGDTFTTGDIMGVYLDLTASKLYFAKNGTIQDSGTGFSITAVGSTENGFYFPAAGDWGASYQGTFDFNFGNGYFGTTEITSPETDEGGIGAFKYNPSTGTFDGSSKDFRAICTQNIKLYGG